MFGQGGFIWAKVVVIGKSGFIRDKSGSIRVYWL